LGQSVTISAADSVSTEGALGFNWLLVSKPANSNAALAGSAAAYKVLVPDVAGTYIVQVAATTASGSQSGYQTFSADSGGASTSAFDHTGIVDNCTSCHDGATAPGKPLDHIPSSMVCEACHNTMTFDDADVNHAEVEGACMDCHDGVIAEGKPDDHIPTTEACDVCHTTDDWDISASGGGTGASDDEEEEEVCDDDEEQECEEEGAEEHPPVGDLSCMSCHDGVIAEGKPADHIETTEDCGVCHNMTDFDEVGTGTPAPGGGVGTTDHPPVGDLSCMSCHDGNTAEGKPADHIETTLDCGACHNMNDFDEVGAGTPPPATGGGGGTTPPGSGAGTPAPFDHTGIVAGCVGCHDGGIAPGKTATHIDSTDMCEACHNTDMFVPAMTVDHGQVLGSCTTCHDGVVATGKPVTHIVTSSECDVCHVTWSWLIPPPPAP
jgi:predicted CXXCH cytochrome family protein